MTNLGATSDENAFKQLYLDAAKVDGKPGVYFIGPFGRRVSFASQQRRALNTVWALEQANKIGPGQDVAVVGGGLAGVTAATALAARKCSVWLYESRPRVLNVQANTMHRFVHPTVNFWPEKDLDATTQFPFMDWYADVCAPILHGVREEWFAYFKKHLTDVYTSTSVTGLKVIPGTNGGSTIVELIADGEGPKKASYNAVLFATGFGSETIVTGVPNWSYWDEDYLPEKCATQRILISGTGDGGLIDALRCVHSDFKQGQLAVTLAAMLDETSIKVKLRETEAKVREQAGNDEAVAASHYASQYPELLSKMSGKCREFLKASLISRSNPVRLVGRLSSPYSMNAAPVHKLMIAHAIAAGHIIYEQGELEAGPVFVPIGQPAEDLTGTLCVARHGAEPPLTHILNDVEVEQLRAKQRILADLLEDRPYDDKHWANWKEYPARDIGSLEFARFRLPLAASHVMKDYKVRLALGLQQHSPVYVLGVDSGGATPTGGFPTSLFGVPTETREADLVDAYAN